jgi:signal transduction histidine kinase
MLVHWARLGGKSKIRLFIIVLPSLILLPRFGELPWLGLEWALSFCIYLVIVANEETLKRRNDEERAQEMVDIVADAVRGAHLAAELTTIAEARLRLHEIRNALNPASLCLGILADEIEGLSEEAREAFESIEQGIRNTSERSTAAMMQLIPSGRAEVVELQEVLEMLATLIDHSSCNLRPEIQGETADILIQGKGKVLAGCLLNLVRNAEEAEATRVTFDISPQRDHVILRVGDNGGGIAEELAPHIFQPGVTAGKPNGSGHALHIVKVILETLGGEIELDRGSERKGTVFLLRLKRTTARELDIIRAAERALLKSTPPRDLIR